MDRRTGIALILVSAILCAGCAGIGGFQAGDIIDRNQDAGDMAYVVLNAQDDEYQIAWILRDNLGRWRLVDAGSKEWKERDYVERFYSHRIGHVDVDDLVPI